MTEAIEREGMMRLILTLAAAALAAGCDRDAGDNRTAGGPPVVGEAPAVAARTIQASFDCERAAGQAQELICADANLAAMDREVARLAALADEPAGRADYAQQRDGCGKADELRQCVVGAAVLEIHRLRTGSIAARSGDGPSVGPVSYSCKGIAGPVRATFVNSDPGAVALDWGGEAIALDHAPTASGSRYDGRWNGEAYAFWNKGREATFTVAGKGDLQCVEAPAD